MFARSRHRRFVPHADVAPQAAMNWPNLRTKSRVCLGLHTPTPNQEIDQASHNSRLQAALSHAKAATSAWVAKQTSPLALAWRISSSMIQIRERYPLMCG